MAARKSLLPQPSEASSSYEDPKRKAPEFDTCNFLIEAMSPEFDPNRVLLQRVFFINEDKTIYVSIEFYPARKNQPLVEFGGSKIKPVLLTQQYVATMADCLPRICKAMCDNEQYGRSDAPFRLNTTGCYRIARFYMDKNYVPLKFQELRYLQNMFHIVQNQLNSYIAVCPMLRLM